DRSDNVQHRKDLPTIEQGALTKDEQYARRKVYEALKKSEDSYANGSYSFNTLIAASMEAFNALSAQENRAVWSEGYFILLNILEPIIPHIASEMSERLFEYNNLTQKLKIDESVFEAESMILAVTVNGKRRAEFEISVNASEEEILAAGKAAAAKWIEGLNLKKEIYVSKKLVNLVVA
ncbi:MAG: class I tRNA ligase family protein, partial [Campylobacteraceae bacterium]|nr:class I tRNA ligase family protein [Campylobacteraceae bacterium]